VNTNLKRPARGAGHKGGGVMQCKAKYEIYDKDGNLVGVFYCTDEAGHEGPHSQNLQWTEEVHKLKMGV